MSDLFDFDAELRAALGDAYELDRELTGSGMSRVFVATERALDRKVVIKVLPPELAAGVNRERFRREIQLAAQLQHPHIVPLHTAGSRGDLLWFTMPFIEGESLRHALHERVRFTPREVVRILHDVADALSYAHARGIIHRDIKPGNVLRSGSHAVVTDFGVAKAISAALPAVGMTTSGMAIGTPAYMAPEQLAGDPAADHRVDIYAVGLLGYELLTGEAPFKAPSPQETMAAQLTRVPEPIGKQRPDAPPALAALLSRCLAKSPADRPQTAAELAHALDEIELSSGSQQPQRARSRTRATALLVIAGAAVLAAVLWRGDRRQPGSVQLAAMDTTLADSLPTLPPRAATLTRDDSLAIARAINQKLAEQQAAVRARAESASAGSLPAAAPRPTTPAAPSPAPSPAQSAFQSAEFSRQVAQLAESLRVEIERAVLDSVSRRRTGVPDMRELTRSFGLDSFRFDVGSRRTVTPNREPVAPRPSAGGSELSREAFAARAANLGPPRRVFLSYPVLGPRLAFLAPRVDSLVDTLRRTFDRSPRFVVIDADTVRQTLARTRTMNSISRSLNVDLFASLHISVLPDTTIIWQVTLRDLGAHQAYATRASVAKGTWPAPLSDTEGLVAETLRWLQEMDRAPRRHDAASHTNVRRP
ncbi:MAG TPA: serine/threonine-protein kinase [Gemmatimonadaceae bacterium]|nr:serine/threonine-protein kinase [Gemmatimonadaceae bacterium]